MTLEARQKKIQKCNSLSTDSKEDDREDETININNYERRNSPRDSKPGRSKSSISRSSIPKGVNDHRLTDFRPQSGASGRINAHIRSSSNNGYESPHAASDVTDKEMLSERSGSPYNHDPDAEEYNGNNEETNEDTISEHQKLHKKAVFEIPQPNIAPPKKHREEFME